MDARELIGERKIDMKYTKKEKAAIDFLIFSYFGFTLDAGEDTIIDKVIDRSYRDASSHVLSVDDSEKQSRKNDASKIIKERLNALTEKFDAWHEDCIDALCKAYENCKYKEIKKKNSEDTYTLEFTYGIAQKWLNMTMKYLYILNTFFPDKKICKKVNELSHTLHVPLDSYIFEAAANEDKSYPWSKEKWSKISVYEDYWEYQEKIKKKFSSPIDWEGNAWLKIAKERNKKNEN